ncbi:sensor histidine kinase [Aquabacterium sp. J223]|uniref:sensor histidine kinase n=1 Tax=Aquabacterium sp. J223 TaxID=2898431 RepID=UPI0021AD6270|nr:histidine kinase [Aquabacterium sp. J223]UUX94941.1 histidine kinase [Aquabacterium sp. J223]
MTTARSEAADPLDHLPLRSAVPAGFDLCHPGLALRAVFTVQSVLLVGALLQAATWWQALSLLGPAVMAGLIATLLWLVAVCAAKRRLAALGSGPRWALVTVWGALCATLGFGLLRLLGVVDMEAPRWVAVPLAGAGLAAVLWAWLVLRLRSRLPAHTAARLAELQSRIRPHFLFNALNTAIALVRVDPQQAESVLEDLAQLFRVALENQGEPVSLADELELAQRYLAIEQVRFGERLQVRWELDPHADAARLPPLLLQPLVENAVRHGVEPSPHGGRIVVRTEARRHAARITILNTVAPQQPAQPGHGIALQNVRERLRLLHDVAAEFEAGPVKGHDGEPGAGFRVRLEVPL